MVSVIYRLFTKIVPALISATQDEAQPVEQARFSYMDHMQIVLKR